jgi:hypothetical protein
VAGGNLVLEAADVGVLGAQIHRAAGGADLLDGIFYLLESDFIGVLADGRVKEVLETS